MDILTVDGVYENGRVELKEKPEGVEKARVRVTFLPDALEDIREAARQRAFARMRTGINFGGMKFDRAQLYEERMQELDARRGRKP
jgi:hypothetical protein